MSVNQPNSKDLISEVQKYMMAAFSRSLSDFVTSHLHVTSLMFLKILRRFIPNKSKIYHHIYVIARMPLIDTQPRALCGIAPKSPL